VCSDLPGRNTGIRFLNFLDHPRLSWSLGFFKETDAAGDGFSDNGDYNITGRLTVTPWYEDKGRQVLHLGLGYSHKIADESLRFRKRLETHISDLQPVDTGRIPADGADMLGPEAALVWGPFCLQGEYWYTRVDSEDFDDPELKGYYLTASYFITGEHRNYKLKGNDGAEFSLVDIKAPFDPARGTWGAWEAAARYAAMDLNDNTLYGGKTDSLTLAVNWYLNSNLRWSFNYVASNVKDSYAKAGIANADADIFQTRLQVSF
jgi:phosphate-selective porin OprO/OprP